MNIQRAAAVMVVGAVLAVAALAVLVWLGVAVVKAEQPGERVEAAPHPGDP